MLAGYRYTSPWRTATEAVPPASARLEVASLNWSHEPAELREAHGTFDVIVGADLVYSSGCVAGLARAVAIERAPRACSAIPRRLISDPHAWAHDW